MPYNSRTYRVLIASPSDVEEEREIAVRVIQEWNDLYSYTRGVVLLPLRWETHSAPEYGARPQEVINRAIVDQCDLLVGVFWTRIGTPTGVADSGTLEEIDRVAHAGKPVMLYFSKVGTDPDRIDLEQLRKLNTFKSATYPNGLTESYKSHVEFRDKFARQLELRVRDLQIADTAGGPPPVALSFAASDLKSFEAPKAARHVELIQVIDLEAGLGRDEKAAGRLQRAILADIERAATVPVVLAISNTGTSGIRNLYVEMDINASSGLTVADTAPTRLGNLSSSYVFFNSLFDKDDDSALQWKGLEMNWNEAPDLTEGFKKTDLGWRLTFEWPALQPNRTRLITPALFVKAEADGKVQFAAKLFADSLPEPASLEATLEITVRRRTVRAADVLGDDQKGH